MNSWEKSPVLAVPRLRSSAESTSNLLHRWNYYAKTLNELSNGQVRGLRIFTFEGDIAKFEDLNSFSFLKVETVPGNLGSAKAFFSFMIFIAKNFNRCHGQPITLICGDPYFSAFVALFVKFIFPKQVILQTQLHGDIYSGWKIKPIFVRYSLKKSNSIRVVSKVQQTYLQENYPWLADKIFVAPVPIDYSKISSRRLTSEPRILFLGRLQNERGIVEAMEILDKLNAEGFHVTVAGDGVARQYVLERIAHFQLKDKVKVMGAVDSQGVKALYESHNFLLSSAPKEGYGLVLREASLSGLKVIAKKSEGSLEAQKDFPNSILLYDSTDMAVEAVLTSYNSGCYQYASSDQITAQQARDQEAVIKLCSTWLYHP